MSEMLLYSEIYIDNLKEMYYNKNEVEIMKNKYLIMLGLTLDELEKFNYEYGDEIVEEYLDLFKEVAIIKEFEPLYSKEEDERRIRNSFRIQALREGREEGFEQGISKGEKNKQIEIAKKMLSKDVPIENIVEFTGLTKEEIEKL